MSPKARWFAAVAVFFSLLWMIGNYMFGAFGIPALVLVTVITILAALLLARSRVVGEESAALAGYLIGMTLTWVSISLGVPFWPDAVLIAATVFVVMFVSDLARRRVGRRSQHPR